MRWSMRSRCRVGLNCSLGPDLMYPFLEELAEKADVAISCYPNAGLPNPLSATGFDLGPEDMARYLSEFARAGLINIAGRLLREHAGAYCGDREGAGRRAAAQVRLEDGAGVLRDARAEQRMSVAEAT